MATREREEMVMRLGAETRRLSQQGIKANSGFEVSVYSGPLHNDRALSDSGVISNASLADRLAHARMLSKSGYNWDQNAACAKIRLGDGAILQNLYPSHSHVKLRNGKIERIDTYTRRFLSDRQLLKEVILVKDYEYNQWARTKPINEKSRQHVASKTIPLEMMESRSTQPTWDTLKTLSMNSTTILGLKNRIFSYDDLTAKFSSPKFLKRLGFIDDESDYEPLKVQLPCSLEQTCSEIITPIKGKVSKLGEIKGTQEGKKVRDRDKCDDKHEVRHQGNEEDVVVSSDNEEYQTERVEKRSEQVMRAECMRPERVPSSRRTPKQRLAMYTSDSTIGSASRHNVSSGVSCSRTKDAASNETAAITQNSDVTDDMATTEMTVNAQTVTTPRVHTVSSDSSVAYHTDHNPKPGSKQSFHPPKVLRQSKTYKIDVMINDKRFVPFSQPVCLCPKLSKEALGSINSPIMQHYMMMTGRHNVKCKLHNSGSVSESLVMKSV